MPRTLLTILAALLATTAGAAPAVDCDSEYHHAYRERANSESNQCTETSLKDTACVVTVGESRRLQFYTSDSLYYGWRTFKTYCHACHAEHQSHDESANESEIIDIIEAQRRLQQHSKANQEWFVATVLNGRNPDGKGMAMPPWRGHTTVARQIDAVYAYVRARADCVLPHLEHGRLKRCADAALCAPAAAAPSE